MYWVQSIETKRLPIQSTTINKLLIIGILVRYLEEKEDYNGVKLLQISRDLYRKFPDCQQFTDILRTGDLLSFLDELDDKLFILGSLVFLVFIFETEANFSN